MRQSPNANMRFLPTVDLRWIKEVIRGPGVGPPDRAQQLHLFDPGWACTSVTSCLFVHLYPAHHQYAARHDTSEFDLDAHLEIGRSAFGE